MADSILKIRTQDGDKPIGYPGLADKPVANKTLDIEGAFADAKVVGDKFKEVKAETDSLKEDIVNIDESIYRKKTLYNHDNVSSYATGFKADTTLYILTTNSLINEESIPCYVPKGSIITRFFNPIVPTSETAKIDIYFLKRSGKLTFEIVRKITDIPNGKVYIKADDDYFIGIKPSVDYSLQCNRIKKSNESGGYGIIATASNVGDIFTANVVNDGRFFAIDVDIIIPLVDSKEITNIGVNVHPYLFESPVNAINAITDSGNDHIYNVFVGSGVYDIMTLLGGDSFYATITESTEALAGLFLPNMVNLYGKGNVVFKGEIPSSKATNLLSTKVSTINTKYSNIIENIEFTARNLRYSCHDETSGTDIKGREKIYRNCKFIHLGNDNGLWAYTNGYACGFNEDDNIVSYGAKLTQDKDIDVLIDVPSGATKVVVGGKIEDCDSASVFYKATVKKETEAYIKRLIGKRSKIFFTVGVRSEGSVDNSIYYDVANAISITVNGTFEQRKDIATFIDNNGVLVGSVSATVTGSTKKTISVPKKAKTVYVSTTYQNLNSAVVFGKYEIEQSNLKGKKIVWLGTSIPAGGKNGIEVADSYPVYIGKMLDATVYNEAVGSSCLHCKNKNRISERNPYGFVENFEGVSRCLTNTLDEMEWIIAHYNDTDVFTKNVPSTLSDEDKEFIRSCSYEKKINKYLTENNFPDLWIIDHGHNDTISDAQELQYEPMEMPWEAKTGFYQKGVLKTSAGKHLIEIDVDGFDMVYLSGVFNVGYDIYDIFDAGGKVKKFEYANITKTVENLEIDCRGASRVAFSTETDKLETVIIKAKSTENLYCYQGAFDFIVKKIKEFNQKAEIYMIGEYENQLRPAISNYQIKTSERWSFPLFKAWNMYGWSQKKIKCTGYWSDGIWVEDGIERETTFLNRWLPDTIHPHSDKSGEALWYMAKYISAWLKNLIN